MEDLYIPKQFSTKLVRYTYKHLHNAYIVSLGLDDEVVGVDILQKDQYLIPHKIVGPPDHLTDHHQACHLFVPLKTLRKLGET